MNVSRLRKAALRYRSIAAWLAVIALVVALAPPAAKPDVISANARRPAGPIVVGDDETAGADGSDFSGGPASGAGDSAGRRTGSARALPAGQAARAKNCDARTSRIRFPSIFAPPCVFAVSDNGGTTYQGVSRDEVLVVRYVGQGDPAVDALLRAAGASDSPEEVEASYQSWAELFSANYETYGRRVRIVRFEASAPSDDDAAARADAVRVATELKPFAVIGGPAPFVDELANRGVVVVTQLQRPIEYFADRAPYVWGTQMSSTQAFGHYAEYVGKRLVPGNAVHAGDAALRNSPRKFGLIYLDTAEGIYKPGVDAFERDLGRYGVTLTDKVAYEGDINTAQEQARVVMARMKDKGVTSILFSGDPLAPIFLTNAATDQDYFPEWVMGGGTLTDTIFFARTYNESQWKNAFGISQLWIRPPQASTEVYYQHLWYFGKPPAARAVYEILYQEIFLLFTGIHLAGPALSPASFRDGLNRYPVSGSGAVTQVQRSWGQHGIWPFFDWTGFDNTAEVWWDPDAQGSDEIGNEGGGQYQWVHGGRRYAIGDWPRHPAEVFDPKISRTSYDTLPPQDQFPNYPPPPK
jgi:hypothetical protein